MSGLNKDRLQYLKQVMEEDIAKGMYFGGTIIVARHGEIGLYEAMGTANENSGKPVKKDSIFSIFSVTKAFTNVLVFRAIELGLLSLTTKIADIVPEFAGKGREDITLFHLLTHSAGLPSVYSAREGMYIDRLDEMVAAICENVWPIEKPGVQVDYAPLVNHAMMGEMVRRVDPKGRSYRQILQEEILTPLKLHDTNLGIRPDMRERHLIPDFRGNSAIEHLGHSDLGPNGAFEEEVNEMPWVGIATTVHDLYRFAEMLRRGGELDGARILSPVTLKLARKNQTGDKPNQVYKRVAEQHGWPVIPAYIGLGFSLRGEAFGNTLFGTLPSPETFGNYGAGSTIFWVDPETDVTFVSLCTGIMPWAANLERWRRISDIVASAAI